MRNEKSLIDWPVLITSGGLLLVFVIAALVSLDFVSGFVNASFAFSVKYFGAFWQILLLGTFIIAVAMAVSRYGRVKLGKLDKPEMSTYKWIAIIMCTLLAGGGVFWAAAEPMYHFTSVPPLFGGIEAGTPAAVNPALAQAFMHWGFLAWAILGTLSTVVIMYGHYHKGMPLKPRTLLYPIFGEKIMQNSVLGTAIDAFSIIAVAAGTIGPIGFLGLQASFGLNQIFGIPNGFGTQVAIIVCVVAVITISAVSGLAKGIQLLSRINVGLTLVLMAAILLMGPGEFIVNAFISSFGMYLQEFIPMSTFRADADWLGWWTVFFWGWFLGYGPMMAIFISSISRGRTIREIVTAVSIISPIVTCFWFTVVGGTGISLEMANPGSISNALNEFGLPAAMISITQQLPLSFILAPAFLLLTILFVATTGDSMAYTMGMAITGNDRPSTGLKVFWSLLMGAIAIILLSIGDGGVSALQSFIVVTAVPVSLILLPMFWLAPRVAGELAREQGIVETTTQKYIMEDGKISV
ncbi:BCCT family transporter [Ammoniphilus sp. CFH 90114]|uniref:BCCT family transporter n=1 Tax=Ammoniphilus sp. CFH 90114 TaxID=2493665 RepID=UPI00100E5D53|nr:BCCT family transporter [Ammoniphilus sp. CFH 90114]RXT05289.1 BCCT family transporter [Ammoniphilus sp. CFH 90114]